MAEFSFTYRAFISYSHADQHWGVWLHRALERYRVPRRLAGAEDIRRLGKVFRDEEEMAAAHEIGPKVEAALKASEVLIVVCSPRSAKSQWVNREIEAFKKLGREHRVFALIVDGRPHDAAQECFPEALKRTLAGERADPFAPDVRKFGREDAVRRLIAGMLDVGYDDLRQREVRRRRAELRRAQALIATGVAAVLAGVGYAATILADATERRSDEVAMRATTLSDSGDYARAMLLALYADPAAQNGLVEGVLRPHGFHKAREALVRGFLFNRLQKRIELGEDVSAVAFSPSGDAALVGHEDGKLQLWSVPAGERVREFAGAASRISATAISPDGGTVFAAAQDGFLRIWSTQTGEMIASIANDDLPTEAVYSPDGAGVMVGPRRAKFWRFTDIAFVSDFANQTSPWLLRMSVREAGGPVRPLDTPDPPVRVSFEDLNFDSAAFSPDGERVATGTAAGKVILWPSAGGGAVSAFDARRGPVSALAFSPDGTRLVLGHSDGSATLWQVETATELRVYDSVEGEIAALAFSADGERLLVGTREGRTTLWNVGDGTLLQTYVAGHDGSFFPLAFPPFPSVTFSRDGKLALSASYNGVIDIWSGEGQDTMGIGETEVWKVQYSPNGDMLITERPLMRGGFDFVFPVQPPPLPDIVRERPDQQVRTACNRLRDIGAMEFTEADYVRFSILDREAPHPCRHVWGFDPLAKREAEAATLKSAGSAR